MVSLFGKITSVQDTSRVLLWRRVLSHTMSPVEAIAALSHTAVTVLSPDTIITLALDTDKSGHFLLQSQGQMTCVQTPAMQSYRPVMVMQFLLSVQSNDSPV